MSTAQKVMAKLRELTPEQQAEVLRLVESPAQRNQDGPMPSKNPTWDTVIDDLPPLVAALSEILRTTPPAGPQD